MRGESLHVIGTVPDVIKRGLSMLRSSVREKPHSAHRPAVNTKRRSRQHPMGDTFKKGDIGIHSQTSNR